MHSFVIAFAFALAGVIVGAFVGNALARIRRQRARRGEGAAPYRENEYPRPYRTGESPYRDGTSRDSPFRDPQRWGDRFK